VRGSDRCYHVELGLRRSTGVKYQIKKKKSEKGQAKTQLKHQKPESEPQGELVNWVYGSFKTSWDIITDMSI